MNSTFSKNTESILNELLKKSEQYQNLSKHANDAILVIEPENETVLEVNDKACEMYGFEIEDFVGLSLRSISKDVEYGDEQRKKLLEIGTCQEFETVQFRADGVALYLHIKAAVIEYEGRPAILSINRDITIRLQTEQALQEREQFLQEREQFLLSVANAAQDAIVSTDNHGNIIFWNEGARRIFGYDAEEVTGISSGILMPERFRGIYAGGIQRFKETGELHIIGKTVERVGQRKDGSEFPVELSLGVWETVKGKCFTGIIRDISERRKAEQIKMFRAREVALRADIGLKFAGSSESLKTKLTHCVESIFTHLDAAFVQIWTFNEAENVLELQADTGICTHMDKLPTRVPIGQFKVGLIAQEQKPRIANDVFIDVCGGNDQWARQNELTSFAGHPLITDGRLIGVVAMFARRELTEETLDVLASVSDIITQSIERTRAEKALEEATKRERAMIENALDVICTVDAQGRFVTINPACFKIWGYRPEELIGRQYIGLIAPEDVAKTIEAAQSIMSGTEATNFENRYIHKNGTLVNTMWTSHWSESEQCMFAVAHDITERKTMENALRENEEKYRELIENANDVLYTLDLSGGFTSLNRAGERLLGYTRAEALEMNIADVIVPKDVARVRQRLAENIRGAALPNFELEIIAKDGNVVTLDCSSRIIVQDGAPVGIQGIGRDITHRKQAESNLLKSEANLAAAQRIAHLGSWEIELSDLKRINNNKVRWSDEVYRIFGYEPGQMDVSINHYFNAVHPIDRKEVRRAFMEAVSHRKDLNIEYRVVLPDGSERLQHGQGEVIYDEQSHQPLKFIGTVQDVTEPSRAEEKLRESEQWLRAILDASRDGIIIEDDSQIIYTNDSYTKLLGYDEPKELVGRDISEFLPPEEAKRLSDFGRRRLRGEEVPSVYEFEGKCKDGTLVEVEGAVSTSIIGNKTYITTAIRDITERRRAENSLQKNLSLLTSTFEATADGILVVNRNNKIKTFNEKFVAMWNIPRDLVLEKDTAQILAFVSGQLGDAENIRKRFEKSFQNPDAVQFDVLELEDGRFYERYSIPQMLEGKVVGRVLSYRDITERKRADAALRESEYKLRTLLTSMNEGLLQVDNEDAIVFVNNYFSEMVGYSQEQLIGKNWSRLLLDDEGSDFISQVNKRRLNGISDRYELCLKKKSGERLFVMVSGVPILDAEEVITGSMGVFTDITERKRIEEQMLHDAFHDALTGLANRALFMDHLRLTIERGKSRHSNLYAVLFLDFDRFKVINDSLGHGEGDNLLKFIARRLESATRTGDLVARLGGDEFVVLLSELVEEGDAVQIAERIQASLKNPFDLNGNDVFISASIGIALSSSGHNRPEDMVRDADIAMYSAKAKGKARYQIFAQAMHEHASKQLQLETEMRRALENRDFLLHYQPIIHLETETLIGFEALVRWKHQERGMIPPCKFIAAAEENNLILPLGQWILEESCRQLRQWQDKKPAAANLSVSVNLSCKQFVQPDLADQIAAILKKTGLDPHCLKLEITESHIMENSEKATMTLNDLRALGVELSLDDFGTGYSSLSYLHRLPVSYLKIDRSFVTRMIESEENSEIVLTIIRLAQNLKLKVVAEGIETSEQLAHLKNLNCEYGQGYFFSKALSAKAAEIFFEKRIESPVFVFDAPLVNDELNM